VASMIWKFSCNLWYAESTNNDCHSWKVLNNWVYKFF